ncbi:MAG: GTP cyclohydrolase I FolE [Saprospiraceae bacterium]|nr:GTP cyclohydrolase I FolE [Saprospiraceae bacterium]
MEDKLNSKNAYDRLKSIYSDLLTIVGEDKERDGLKMTPHRVARSMQFLLQGYDQDPDEILQAALFDEKYSEMVIVKDIELYSMCEHHMIPFFGKAHIAYVPDQKIVGLSKLPRIVDVFARRLQVQERLTNQILYALDRNLKPQGVAVVIEAQHMCMMMRGVQKQNSVTTTSAFTGIFEKMETRSEFLRLIGSSLH